MKTMSIKQVCVRTTPEGYGKETATLNEFLLNGFKVVMVSNYFVDIINKNIIYGNEYILQKEVDDDAD